MTQKKTRFLRLVFTASVEWSIFVLLLIFLLERNKKTIKETKKAPFPACSGRFKQGSNLELFQNPIFYFISYIFLFLK